MPSTDHPGASAALDADVAPVGAPDWVGLSAGPLPVDEVARWAVDPRCGAVVTFTGTTRDRDRDGREVALLEYEAWEEQAVERLGDVAAELRRRWPEVGRVGLLHRTGQVAVSETSVVVCVSAPHRDEAFVAARWGIDAVKAAVPIWKQEVGPDGARWADGCEHGVVHDPADVPVASAARELGSVEEAAS